MKTITVVFAAVVILIVGKPGSVPFLVLCSARGGGADYNRFASSSFLTQAILVAEYVRLNGVFRSPRKKEEEL